jgi:hypothetical protein
MSSTAYRNAFSGRRTAPLGDAPHGQHLFLGGSLMQDLRDGESMEMQGLGNSIRSFGSPI